MFFLFTCIKNSLDNYNFYVKVCVKGRLDESMFCCTVVILVSMTVVCF